MKEGIMHDEKMKSVFKNNAPAVMRITVFSMETEIL